MPRHPEFPETLLFDAVLSERALSPGRNEVETMRTTVRDSPVANPHASGGDFRQVLGLPLAGAVAGEFDGPAGDHELTVGSFDESDGLSSMQIPPNADVLSRFLWDAPDLTTTVTNRSPIEYAQGAVYLEAGDESGPRGSGSAAEPLRMEYLDVTAAAALSLGTTLRIEAESLDTDGYVVECNGAASGGASLRTPGPGAAAAFHTIGDAGTFDVEIGYFDETDGVSHLAVYRNDELLASIDWDAEDGNAIASRASAKSLRLDAVAFEEGDVLKLAGTADGEEPLRLDYVDLTAVEAPSAESAPRLPDLWYVLDGEVKLSLNRGAGLFDWQDGSDPGRGIPTGIETGAGEVAAADYDGDGDTDFLHVEVSEPFPMADGSLELDQPGTLSITVTFHENDGRANFSASEPFSGTFEITWDALGVRDANAYAFTLGLEEDYVPTGYFDFADAADMDGDRDLDFFGFSMAAAAPLVFENLGDNTFALLEHRFPFEEPGNVTGLSYYDNFGFFADMNGDDDLDIIYVADYLLSSTFVLINDGTGSFSSTARIYGGDDGAYSQVVGDLDGDGDNDLALVGISDGGEILAFVNDGTGASAGFASYPPSYETLKGSVEVGDFDADGADEILNAGFEDAENGFPAGLRTFRVDRENSVLIEESYHPVFSGNVIGVADFDGDGDLDFLGSGHPVFDYDARHYSHPPPRLFLNDGTGSFTPVGEQDATPDWGDVLFPRIRPEVGIGFFDDPYALT